MSLKDVLDRFALVSGLSGEEVSKWVFVIIDCIKYFEKALKNKTVSENDKRRLIHSCAVYAYYKYSLMMLASNITKFKAGDIEITCSENLSDTAHQMWQIEKKEIADIIDFDDFCFCRVN